MLSILFCTPQFFALHFETFEDGPTISSISNAMFNMSDELGSNQTSMHFNFNSTETVEANAATMVCLMPSEIMFSREYILWYKMVATLIITGIIPFLFLALFNFKIYMTTKSALYARECLAVDTGSPDKDEDTTTYSVVSNGGRNSGSSKRGRTSGIVHRHSKYIDGLDKKQKNEEHSQATVLLGIVIAFFICHILRIVLNVEEIVAFEELNKIREEAAEQNEICSGVQLWTMLTNDVSHLLLQVNSSITFFIYIYFSTQFKEASKSTLIQIARCFHLYKIDTQEINGGSGFNTKNTSGVYVNSQSTPTINRKRSKNQSKKSLLAQQLRGGDYGHPDNNKKGHVVALDHQGNGEKIQNISIELNTIEKDENTILH